MEKNKQTFWLPVIIAASLILGICIGNRYISLSFSPNGGAIVTNVSEYNKLNTILRIIDEKYVDTVDVARLVESTIPKLFEELDPHSLYIPAEEAKMASDDLEGSFSGIGVSFNMQSDTILIITVIGGGPAEKAGLLPFDRIITIDDSLFAGRDMSQTQIMRTLRGEHNSVVKLGIQRGEADSLLYFDVTRGNVPVLSVDVSFPLNEQTGYIKVSKFGRTTYSEFITALAKLKQAGCEAFIIDLRGNTGGYMDAAVNLVNEFLPKGQLIVYSEGNAFPRTEVHANGTGACLSAPLVVLTDETSASASEIFAGAIQDNDRGLIVGRRTFGKGLVQSPIELRDGSEVRLTIARYYTPSGRSIQKEYALGKSKDYGQDIYNRYLHGEFDSADSIRQHEELRYQTIGGRTVYGGGGIMPDIFIPRDTSGMTSYYTDVINNGALYRYALTYSDRHHDLLAAFSTWPELHAYLQEQPLLDDFTAFAETTGIRRRPTLIRLSAALIEKQLQAYIVRNFFDEAGFYPIFLQDDIPLLRAVRILQQGSALPAAEFIKQATSNGQLHSQAGHTPGNGKPQKAVRPALVL